MSKARRNHSPQLLMSLKARSREQKFNRRVGFLERIGQGRPRFAQRLRDDGSKASLQPYIRTFCAATRPLSLMEYAG